MQDNQNNSEIKHKHPNRKHGNIRWLLFAYDLIIFLAIAVFTVVISFWNAKIPVSIYIYLSIFTVCLYGMRFVFRIYEQMWRYGGVQAYIKLILSDAVATLIYTVIAYVLDTTILDNNHTAALVLIILSTLGVNLVIDLGIRFVYRHAFQISSRNTFLGKFLRTVFRIFANVKIQPDDDKETQLKQHKTNVAIVGAGSVGVSLAKELLNNSKTSYKPRFFIEISNEKIGRTIFDLPVYSHEQAQAWALTQYNIGEIVFALPKVSAEEKKKLYDQYKNTGCKIRVYDFPTMQVAGGEQKRQLRYFDIDELLFRKPIQITDERTNNYYKGKVILITGGGGSIGSELCRQIAKMDPKLVVILDVYENGAYDVQQELRLAYGAKLNLKVEILSVCDRIGLEQVFAEYRPQIVINAAAHKHVPLMEHNCCEAVKNNVFGTLNTVEMAEKYGAERFMMVSTDKAVNPTNVMGATKRMCEMIVQSHGYFGGTSTKFSATRFGNVLGSAGSVIPLFRKQIANGGPITLTDFRIIRYFMTIPEASGLVLQSGAMANNGELFVLDMGQPVKILDLAENMIRLSGLEPYSDINIIETGLRPGEKLYEELLVKSEELDKTENNLIFIERDAPLPLEEIQNKLEILREALETNDNETVKLALRKVVPTFKTPEEVNKDVGAEVKMQ